MEGFNSGGTYLAGQIPRVGKNKSELFGTALFRDNIMIGELTGDETRYMLMARGEFKRGYFTMRDPGKAELIVALNVRQEEKPKVKVIIGEEGPIIELIISLDLDLLSIQSEIKYDIPPLKSVLEERFAEDVKHGVESVINRCQDLEVDVFLFGTQAVKRFKTIDQLEDYDWNKQFKSAEVNVKVNARIRRSGTMIVL